MTQLSWIKDYVWLIPALPLLGFILNGVPLGLCRIKMPKAYVHGVAVLVMLLSFLVVLATFGHLTSLEEAERSFELILWPWMHVGALKVDIAFLIDPLTCVMMLIITGIGTLIHMYSIGYMHEDPDQARFFSYLNLFCFMMLLLVMGNNLFLLFVGWEGVGLCSYLLIGFWFKEKANGVAGMKAFLVNRVGDFGLMIGLLILFWGLFSVGMPTLNFVELKDAVPALAGMSFFGISVTTLICIFLFVGCTGKSAQVPLYVWLPDAMAGPTPVSALIHAATMVTAGVYMIARMNWLFEMSEVALMVIATVGAFTAFFAATIGFAQNDIKKVLAYSTVSQLGYMFLAMGTGAYTAGVFHLMTHAFFKACLFLGSGSVILGMHHEQDMRLMGGLRKYMPVTFATFLLATIAIAGVFPFSGFFSKDEILFLAFEKAHHNHWYYVLWIMGMLGAMGTAFYMFRAVTMTFFGTLRANDPAMQKLVHGDHSHDAHHDDHGHGTHHHELVPHESPKTMTLALVVLAGLSVFGGLLNMPYAVTHALHIGGTSILGHWLAPVIPHAAHHEIHTIEYVLMFVSVGVAITFLYLGYLLYSSKKSWVENFVAKFPNLYDAVYKKYFVDELYFATVVNFVMWFRLICFKFDQKIVDGVVNLVGLITKLYSTVVGWFDHTFVDGLVNSVANACYSGGGGLRRLQSGKIQHYAYGAILGVVVVLVSQILW